MIQPTGFTAVARGSAADEPCIGLVAWFAAPCDPPAIVAIATADRDRQRVLADMLGVDTPVTVPRRRRSLWLVPDAVVVDTPALLASETVARLLTATNAVVLGADDDLERSLAIVLEGAAALLPGDVSAPSLQEAVGCVLRGEAVVPSAVASAVLRRLRAAERTA